MPVLGSRKISALGKLSHAVSPPTMYGVYLTAIFFRRVKVSNTQKTPSWPDTRCRAKSVTYVAGTFCHLCVRAGPGRTRKSWRRGWDSNPRMEVLQGMLPVLANFLSAG
jgi:hypothetical protein